MKLTTSKCRLAAAMAIATIALSACAPPPVLVSNRALGDRILRIGLQRTSIGSVAYVGPAVVRNPNLYNLILQVCSLDQDGQPANCRATLVLDRANPDPDY